MESCQLVTKRGSFAQLVLLAIGIRLVLLPLSHTWDAQTWVNTLAQLGLPGPLMEVLHRPYETMRELSLLTQADGSHLDFYEYWAYPPLMLYVYWPVAKIYALSGGHLATFFPAQPTFYAPSIPLAMQAVIHLPMLLADLGSLFVMRGLGVSMAGLRWYAVNPLVLLIGVWTFDSVMVFFLLLAIFFADRKRWFPASVALGLGAATKYIPLVVLPAFIVSILLSAASWREVLRAGTTLALGLGGTLAALVLPFAGGVAYALQFQTARFGGNLTVEQLWRIWARLAEYPGWQDSWQLYASTILGALLLPLALLVGCWIIVHSPGGIAANCLMLVLAFLAGSKLVNEPYVLAALALLTVEVDHYRSDLLVGCRSIMWILALAYASVNTPLWAFFFSMAQQLSAPAGQAIRTWVDSYRLFLGEPQAAYPFALLGVAFWLLILLTAWAVWRQSLQQRAICAA